MLLHRILRESACQSSEEARPRGAGGAGGAHATHVSAGGGRALPKLLVVGGMVLCSFLWSRDF